MGAVVVKNGLQKDLQNWLSGELSLLTGYRLYTNNYDPTLDSVDTDFHEPTWGGYVAQVPTGYTAVVFDGVNAMFTSTNLMLFPVTSLPSGPVTVYGWFAKTAAALVYAEKFAVAQVVDTPGLPFGLQVTIKVRNP